MRAAKMETNECLSIQDVAKRLGVNTTTVYRLTLRGTLPAFKVGSQWRFSRLAIESWIADQTTIEWFKAEDRGGTGRKGGGFR